MDIEQRERHHQHAIETRTPIMVSLVVPVRDEAATIQTLLDSIAAQSRQPDEVVFVDGGSVDDTVARLRDAGLRDNRIRVIEAGDATPGRGRNVGIAAARCEWIALTDAGIRLEPQWLEKLVEAVRRDPAVEVVYGNYEPAAASFFERCAALAYVAPKAERPGGRMRGPSTASSLLRREVWEAAGGFPDLRAAEDLIFMERVRERGCKVAWAAEATVWWQLQPTLGKTFRKFRVYSRHNVRAGWQRYWHYGVARQYLIGLLGVMLAAAHSPWWLALPVAGFLARVAKSIWMRREGRGVWQLLNPFQFAGVGIILLAIDLAMFLGWWQVAWKQSLRGQSGNESGVKIAGRGWTR
ncbi:MAG TPA: glycosyltransferase [Blastocatellia bacterium]|nr:glycosyltransferase [Blastocatellia bacterium]